MFKLTNLMENVSKGVALTLDNGYTVSIQWGPSNYCDNYGLNDRDSLYKTAPPSATAETAVIAPNGKFVKYKGDDVQPYQTVADVIETLATVAYWEVPDEIA